MGKYIETWSPLTGEPELMTQLMYDLGVEPTVVFQDVLDIETDLNDALALIVIYPESADDERSKDVEEKQREHDKSELVQCFVKQNIDNACGMFAIVNAVLNSSARFSIKDGSILSGIAQRRSIEVSDEIRSIYNKAIIEDDSDAPVDYHFTVLVEVQAGGLNTRFETHVVELDSERLGPYVRASSNGTCLQDASLVRGIFDTLRKGKPSAAIYKLSPIDS